MKTNNTSIFDLDKSIEHLRHFLPSQGPIKDFIHHNTLHAYQDLPFNDAVIKAVKLYKEHLHMPLSFYREKYASGEISKEQIELAIEQSELIKKIDKKIIWDCLFDFVDLKDLNTLETLGKIHGVTLEQINIVLDK